MSEAIVNSESITSGFFDSYKGDRTYNAEQMSRIFEGIITDGVFGNYPAGNGDSNQEFYVSQGTGLNIIIGAGRAWFNSVWVDNRSQVTHELAAGGANARIDSVFIKIDKGNTGTTPRSGRIVVVEGTPAASPSRPNPTNTTLVHYYRLADVRINAQATTIHSITNNQLDIITAPLQTINAQALIEGWSQMVDQEVAAELATYLSNDSSKLYQMIRGTPVVWLVDANLPTVGNVQSSIEKHMFHNLGSAYPTDYQAAHTVPGESNTVTSMLYPKPFVYAGGTFSPSDYVPKLGDIVIGKNGYYSVVRTFAWASLSNGNYYCEVLSVGRSVVPEPDPTPDSVFRIGFGGGSQEETHEQCNKTYAQIKEAYDNDKLLYARYAPVDIFDPSFSWSNVHSYVTTQYEFYPLGNNPFFVFTYEDIAPDSSSVSEFSWTRYVWKIDSHDVVTIYFEEV